MSEDIVETYRSIIYCHTFECPCCEVYFNDETEHRDRFIDKEKRNYHIVDCHNCGTRLQLVISHETSMYLEIKITPVAAKFT